VTPPGAGEAQPLTTEEEAALRVALAAGDSWPRAVAFDLVPRLLATLDAARATQPAGLREALRDALVTALSVTLHEHADPACSGDPPYGATQEQAVAIVNDMLRMPVIRAVLATTSAGDADGHDHWYACVRCGADNGLNEASGGEPARYLRMAAEDEAEQTTAVAPRELQEALRRADEALHNARWYLANLNLTSADSMGIARRDAALSAVDAALKANGPLLIRAASVDDER
jgi:hypothetical protein